MKTLEYLAGFFDGEGCISSTIQNRGWRNPQVYFRVGAVQLDRRPLDALQERFGGAVKLRSNRSKPIWQWYITSRPLLARFVVKMEGRLLVKASQLKLLRRFVTETADARRHNSRAGRTPRPTVEVDLLLALSQEMQRLNHCPRK